MRDLRNRWDLSTESGVAVVLRKLKTKIPHASENGCSNNYWNFYTKTKNQKPKKEVSKNSKMPNPTRKPWTG